MTTETSKIRARKITRRLTRWETENLTLRLNESEMEAFTVFFPDQLPRNVFFNGHHIGKRTCNMETHTFPIGMGMKECRPGDSLIIQNYNNQNQEGKTAGEEIFIYLSPRSIEVQEKFTQTYLKVREALQGESIENQSPEVQALLFLMNENKHLLEENARIYRDLDSLRRDQERFDEIFRNFQKNPIFQTREELLFWISEHLDAIRKNLTVKTLDYPFRTAENEIRTVDILAMERDWGLVPIHYFSGDILNNEQGIFSAIRKIRDCEESLRKEVTEGKWDSELVTSILLSPVQNPSVIEKCLVHGIKLALLQTGYSLDVISSNRT